jgi:hypothetical protein
MGEGGHAIRAWGWPTSPPLGGPRSLRHMDARRDALLRRRSDEDRAPRGERCPTQHSALRVDEGAPGVSERGGEPPGPIPNPVVPPASAGGVLGGQPPGKRGPRARHPPPHQPPSRLCLLSLVRVAGWSSGSSLGS